MNIAIVGYGKMGKYYDALLHAKYIIDVVITRPNVSFSNVDEFIAYGQPVDLVIVATPMHTHYDIVRKLLLNGNHVLCEKPISIASQEVKELEEIARDKQLTLYQSTLERYSPLIKFVKKNVLPTDINRIESYRYGVKPGGNSSINPLFDLGIHDMDLWFYLTNCQVAWSLHAGYGSPQRAITVYLKDGRTLKLDLLEKQIRLSNGAVLDLGRASANNPMLEMVYDVLYRGMAMNEDWSEEIACIEHANGDVIELLPKLLV